MYACAVSAKSSILKIRQVIDRIYTKCPFSGSRQLNTHLHDEFFTACREKQAGRHSISGYVFLSVVTYK